MAYNPTHPHWAPGIAGGTIVSAVALNEMDTGILDASTRLDSLTTQLSTTNDNVTSLSTQVATLQGQVGSGGGGTGGTGGAVSSVAGRTGNVILTKTDVGLPNVDNTADANKPVSTPQQNALNLKANAANPVFTGTATGLTAAMVGLGSVDNTADSAKPVSTPQQNALNLKASLANPTFTGTVNGITKAMVGLGNVDNTADATKFSTYGLGPVIHYTGTAWPNRTLPTGYTGAVVWESELYANVAAPSGAIDGDRWSRKRAA